MARRFISTMLYLNAGLLIWAANFLFTYVFTAVVCARGVASTSFLAPVVIIATVLAVIAAAWVLMKATARARTRSSSNSGAFIDFVAAALAALSIVALLWTGFVAGVSGQCAR